MRHVPPRLTPRLTVREPRSFAWFYRQRLSHTLSHALQTEVERLLHSQQEYRAMFDLSFLSQLLEPVVQHAETAAEHAVQALMTTVEADVQAAITSHIQPYLDRILGAAQRVHEAAGSAVGPTTAT